MSANAFGHAIRFEIRRTLRDRLYWVGTMMFVVVSGIGAWMYWSSLPPRPSGGRLFGEAYVLALVMGAHVGIARDRTTGFESFLAANFVDTRALYIGKVAAAVAHLALTGIIGLGVALAFSAGDVNYATHYASLFCLASLLMLPGMVLVELGLNTRYPVAVLLILFFAFLAVYGRANDARELLRALGMDGNVDALPAVIRSSIALAATAACYPVYRFRVGSRVLADDANPP